MRVPSSLRSGGVPAASPPSLRRNIGALSALQIAKYVVPFVTVPYLTRVLGPRTYGEVAFAQALVAYPILLVDFGFSWSATRKVAARRDDRNYVSRVFMGAWTAQWLLVVLAASIIGPVLWYVPRLHAELPLYAAAFTSVVGTATFPIWLLQGLERLQAVAAIQVLTQMLVLVAIFLLVRSAADFVRVPLIAGVTTIVAGALALGWIHRRHWIVWCVPSWRDVRSEMRDSVALFGTKVAVSFYTALVPLALGFLAGPIALADFTIANKVTSAVNALLTPVSTALYPRVSHLFAQQDNSVFRTLRLGGAITAVVAVLGGIGMFVLAHWVIMTFGGRQFMAAVPLLRWMAPLPLIIGFSGLFAVQVLLARGLVTAVNMVLVIASVLGVVLIVPLVRVAGATGAVQAMLVTELVVTVGMTAMLHRHGLLSGLLRGAS